MPRAPTSTRRCKAIPPSRRLKVDLTDHDALRYWSQSAAQLAVRRRSPDDAPPGQLPPPRLDGGPPRPAAPRVRSASRSPRAPAGVGLDSHAVRARMVQKLAAQGVRDPRVLARDGRGGAASLRRHALANQAYEDTSLPIGLGQTISKPNVVARMIELLLGAAPTPRASWGACSKSARVAATRPRC
jgi:hypothetical protein